MKKFLNIALPIFIMIAMAVICVIIYFLFTDKISINVGQDSDKYIENTQQGENVEKDEVILAEDELPTLDSMIATRPLLTTIVRDFTQNQELNLNFSKEEDGYQKLIKGEIDLLLATEPSEDILRIAESSEVELEMIPIAKEGFVFYVNNNNPISNLKVSDIQQIYTGQIKNWSQLGGRDAEIFACQRTPNSANQRQMISSVMKTLKLMEPPTREFEDKSYGIINDVIATYDNSENAIGYSYYYDAKQMYNIATSKDVNNGDLTKILSINDIEPNYENIKNEQYPFITNYYLVKLKNNNSETMQIFIDAINSDRGKKIIKEAGYIDN